jgi:hypothetical protein
MLSDDFRKILTDEIGNFIKLIITEGNKIHGIEFYLRDEANSFLWSEDNYNN